MYLSAMLKRHGHSTAMVVAALEKDTVGRIVALKPDLIAFSCLTCDFHWALGVAAELREKVSVPFVFGGTHVMLNAESVIKRPEVDILCVGEGELPLAELADALVAGQDYSGIANLWVKRNGSVVRNEMRDLVQDLDQLPFPDRVLYASYPYFQRRAKRPVAISRGCPYDCTYCHNRPKKELFRGKGKYVRWRSIDSVLQEIDEIEKSGFVRLLHFTDDGFGLNREWLLEFMRKLMARKTRHRVQAGMRADMVTDELCSVLREYGPKNLRLRIAVESGNEEFRRIVLKKSLSNEKLLKAADTFHRHGLAFSTYNMLCLPGETYENGLETLRLNLTLRPEGAFCYVFQPYAGTELAAYAVGKGYLSAETVEKLGTSGSGTVWGKSLLRQPDIHMLLNLHRMFALAVKFPFLAPLVSRIARYRAAAPFATLCYKVYARVEMLQRRLTHNY